MNRTKTAFIGFMVSAILFGCSAANDAENNQTEVDLELDTQEEVVESEDQDDSDLN